MVCLYTFMNGLAKTSLDVPAWHLCKCIYSVWSSYKHIWSRNNPEEMRKNLDFM